MKLATVIVFVRDVTAMKAFYGGVIGMEIVEDAGGWVRLDGGGTSVALHALPGEPAGNGAPRRDAYVKLAFHASDIDGERERLMAAGVTMGEVVRFGAIALCDGVDPEGNVFQVSSRPRVRASQVIPTHRCADLARALAFYVGVLGAEQLWQDAAYVGVRWRGIELHLSTNLGDGAPGAATVIRVDDVDAVFEALKTRGYVPRTDRGPVFEGPTDQTWGTRELYVSDPDGNTLRFQAERSG